jgi:hypothetical protein
LQLTPGSATAYNFPASICATANLSCVAVGQIVTVHLALAGGGDLSIDSLAYMGAANSQYVKGLVISASTSGAVATSSILVLRGVNVSTVTPGEVATVSVASGATFNVATAAYPTVTGVTFAGTGSHRWRRIGSRHRQCADLQHIQSQSGVIARHRRGGRDQYDRRIAHSGWPDGSVQQRRLTDTKHRRADGIGYGLRRFRLLVGGNGGPVARRQGAAVQFA